MSDSSQIPDELNKGDSDNDSINILRDLVEKLSTSEGKTISWKALSKLVEVQDPAFLIDPLEECLSDGCRIIRELPARSLQSVEGDGSPKFKFQVPYSVRYPADPKLYLSEEDVSERTSLEKDNVRWALDSRTEKMVSNNKKRKSVRAQSYLKREAEATTDDMSRADEVHDVDYGSDESRFREISDEEAKEGSEVFDDIEVPRRFWYRKKEDRLPFSHEEKVRRLRAVQARCRVRRIMKAREEKLSDKDRIRGKKGGDDLIEESGRTNEADKASNTSGNSKKPSRVERRAAALRRENGGAKARPTLAELRARIGKGPQKEEVTLAPVADEEGEADESQVILPPSKEPILTSPPPQKKAAVKKIAAAPTCLFTFTSQFMAANRLISMRAELDTLHKNLQEARKDFEDLRRLEKETAASRVNSFSTEVKQPTANKSHDKMLQSVKALTASCKAVTSVAAAKQRESKVQDRGSVTSKVKPDEAFSSTKIKATPGALSPDRVPANPSAISTTTSTTSSAAASSIKTTADASSKPLPPTAPPSIPPPPPPTSANSPTPPQQKTPPPLSRRRKANMSNIHHISNHRPSRQPTSEGGGNSAQQQLPQQETNVPGMDHPTTTTNLFANEWMCVFCEYRLLYGEYPRMMGAVKSRKKLVAKKKDAQERAHRATTVGAPVSKSRMQCTCGRAHARAMQAVAKELGEDDHNHHDHDHDHDHDHHHHHDHDHDHHHHHHHHHDQDHDHDGHAHDHHHDHDDHDHHHYI